MEDLFSLVSFIAVLSSALLIDNYLIVRETKYRDRYHPKHFFPLFDDVTDTEVNGSSFRVHTIQLQENEEYAVHASGESKVTYLHEGDKIVDVCNAKEQHKERFFLMRDNYPLLTQEDLQEIHGVKMKWKRVMRFVLFISILCLIFKLSQYILK